MRFLRNDKFVDKGVANCGENQWKWQFQFEYQKSIGLTTNWHKFENFETFDFMTFDSQQDIF